jgi:pyridoxamine 5'-phosphate oxidase
MRPWLPPLLSSLDAECGPRPRIVALATVDERGRPRVRSVVCRRIEEDGTLWVASDARSAKNRHIRANPAVEVVFWLPAAREQFRLAGTASFLDDHAARERVWRELSDESRALFAWPEPGEPAEQDASAFAEGIPAGDAIPESFEVLLVHPEEVERLELRPFPHRRTRWRQDEGWRATRVNP